MNENSYVTQLKEEKPNKRLRHALIRVVIALLLAVVLLAIPGFSIVELLEGPGEVSTVQDEETGAFVSRDVYAILGFYADETTGSRVTARYALVPMGSELVTVRFTSRYLEAAGAVCDSTYDWINGYIQGLDNYVTVQGTVGVLKEDSSALMYDWFDLNYEQLVEMGMIAATSDYATYLSETVLIVDTVNGYHQNLVITLGIIAGLLLLYMIVELVMMATGRYLPKEEKPAPANGEDMEDDKEPAVLEAVEVSGQEENEPDSEPENADDIQEPEADGDTKPEEDADSGDGGESEEEAAGKDKNR